jgi:transposase-like protein
MTRREETTIMKKDTPTLGKVIEIDEARIKDHLGELVRGSVEDTLNTLLEAEADQMCNAARYERTEARRDTRAGTYERKLQTQAGEVKLKVKEAAQRIQDGIAETLTYYSFPASHWRRIRTNNPLERIMREIRRRTRVVGAFPDGKSALMLAAARLRHIAGTQWGTKRYLKMDLLRDLDLPETHVA